MMALSLGQYYCVSLNEENCSIQLSVIIKSNMEQSAAHRDNILHYFQSKLNALIKECYPATTQPIAYIPCCHCNFLHLKLELLHEEVDQFCQNTNQHLPKQYYRDLTTSKGLIILAIVYIL